jgi:NAD+ kinase
VHSANFGDRLVAKFGLPVRGFRDARPRQHHEGPGRELPPGPNVLTRDILTADGARAVGEVGGAVAHDDSSEGA